MTSPFWKRTSFSHNSQKWHPFSENARFSWTFSACVRFSLKFSEFFRKSTNSTVFLKMCVFREHLVNVCGFRGHLVNSGENLQILPLGSVRLLRRIRRNDIPFLKTCVFFVEFGEINIFPQKFSDFRLKKTIFSNLAENNCPGTGNLAVAERQ